jgi:hypothetical protein
MAWGLRSHHDKEKEGHDMGGKPVGVLILLLSCVGCHACSSNCDYLPPVADGPYTVPGQRAGSAFGGPVYRGPMRNGPLPDIAEEMGDEQAAAARTRHKAIIQTLDELLATD